MTPRLALVALALALLPACSARRLPKVEDPVPPVVRVTAPADGATVQDATPAIEIDYADEQSGISVVSFRVLINGVDYSADFDHHSRGASGRISAARPIPLGENRLTVEVHDRAGNRARAETTFVNAGGGWLAVTAVPGAGPRRNVELILDASGSMREAIGLGTRMEAAKAAVRSLVEALPAGTPLGLRVFRDCRDIASLVPIEPIEKGAFVAKLEGIEPAGGTPLVASLLESLDTLSRIREGERIAVLVTDGGESCQGSIEQAVSRARDAATRVIVIGFDITQGSVNDQLRRLAEGTGGAFFDAREPEQLRLALERSVLRLGYRVFDPAGREAGRGDVDGGRLELPLGTYRVRLDTAPPVVVEDVAIGPLSETTVELRRAGGRVAAEVRGPTRAAGAPGAARP